MNLIFEMNNWCFTLDQLLQTISKWLLHTCIIKQGTMFKIHSDGITRVQKELLSHGWPFSYKHVLYIANHVLAPSHKRWPVQLTMGPSGKSLARYTMYVLIGLYIVQCTCNMMYPMNYPSHCMGLLLAENLGQQNYLQ